MKKECKWEFDGVNSLIPILPSLDFNESYYTHDLIDWRGISIEITISKSRSGMPVTSEYSFLLNEKNYRYFGTLTYGGGQLFGDVPPPIISGDYKLTFIRNRFDIILTEENINGRSMSKENNINPFEIKTINYPIKEKSEPFFKFKSEISQVKNEEKIDDDPLITLNKKCLTFDNGKLIYGAEDVYIEKEGVEQLFKLFGIDSAHRNKLLKILKEKYLNDYEGFKVFIEIENIPYQIRRL